MKSVEDAIALQLTNVKIPKSAEKKRKEKKVILLSGLVYFVFKCECLKQHDCAFYLVLCMHA